LVNKKILDVGCGSGLDLEFFAAMGSKALAAIDSSDELIKLVKEKFPNNDIHTGDFNYLPWNKNEFDLVWSKYAIQHANDITVPLQEMFRVLKQGGTAYLQVTHPMRTAGMLTSKNYFDNHAPVHYPTIDGKIITEPHHTCADWMNAIIEAGFAIEKVEEIINRPMSEYKGPISPSAIIFILKK
jgi:ubiquinone/menaquinone biosynthesis C-methylase UbiE